MSCRITAVICFLFGASVASAAPPAKDVNVVNTPDVNVVSMPPVEANVTGPIEATINDPVEVIVNEMPGVVIDNGPGNPVPVITEEFIREPVKAYADLDIASGTFSQAIPLYQVPVDKKLVVEMFTILVRQFDPSLPVTYIARITRPGELLENIPLLFPQPGGQLSNGQRVFNGSQSVRMVFDSNEIITILYGRNPIDLSVSGEVQIRGYLIPADSPTLSP